VRNVWPCNHVLCISLSSCVFVHVSSLCIFSVTFCSYVLQLLNISKALTGKFIQTGEFSITGSLHSAAINVQLSVKTKSDFLLQGILWVQFDVWPPFQDTWRTSAVVLVKGWQARLEVDVTPATLPPERRTTQHEENREGHILL
jgi:hypothetical protein